ncbi:hypothetical protein KKB64_00985 [Patescibacteria group bacterium]|nr:hypothetical protein [Patescibacteria group bacterium]MBU1472349.1 hypothetical protein [Patescibacteria group bacterium]MBU2460399.1 hypothetical protein [Patescibacteria group bacterium]MBU2544220.1 hypothetical protein [Patescibacteria group bacterium]
MDPVQITIVIISFGLTILLVVLGIQVWYILKEMKFSLQKINKMLDDMGKMTGTVSDSMAGVAGLVSGLKAGLSLFGKFRHKEADHD